MPEGTRRTPCGLGALRALHSPPREKLGISGGTRPVCFVLFSPAHEFSGTPAPDGESARKHGWIHGLRAGERTAARRRRIARIGRCAHEWLENVPGYVTRVYFRSSASPQTISPHTTCPPGFHTKQGASSIRVSVATET